MARGERRKARDEHDRDIVSLLECILQKQTCMESRQCARWGESTDAARFADAFMRGQTAVMSRKQLEVLCDQVLLNENLAATKYTLGDLAGASALFEKVYAVRSKTLPDEHPDLQTARGNLAMTKYARGDLAGASAVARSAVAGAQAGVSSNLRSPREMQARSVQASKPLSCAATLLHARRDSLEPSARIRALRH